MFHRRLTSAESDALGAAPSAGGAMCDDVGVGDGMGAAAYFGENSFELDCGGAGTVLQWVDECDHASGGGGLAVAPPSASWGVGSGDSDGGEGVEGPGSEAEDVSVCVEGYVEHLHEATWLDLANTVCCAYGCADCAAGDASACYSVAGCIDAFGPDGSGGCECLPTPASSTACHL